MRRELAELLKQGKTIPFARSHVAAQRFRPQRRGKGKGAGRRRSGRERRICRAESRCQLNDFADPRVPLMEWLQKADNPYFARAFVNRVWANYFNAGIVEPPDDMSLANPPSNRPLLDYLSTGFVEHAFDMKWLHREISNSRTYQLSWHERDERAGREEFQPRGSAAVARGSRVRCRAAGRASDARVRAMQTS